MATALFRMGKIYITVGILRACASFPMPPEVLIIRHATGDWAEMSKDDHHANTRAIHDGSRIVSAYRIGDERFIVVTEGNREKTTIALMHEY